MGSRARSYFHHHPILLTNSRFFRLNFWQCGFARLNFNRGHTRRGRPANVVEVIPSKPAQNHRRRVASDRPEVNTEMRDLLTSVAP
jgi:hypothetical protein